MRRTPFTRGLPRPKEALEQLERLVELHGQPAREAYEQARQQHGIARSVAIVAARFKNTTGA